MSADGSQAASSPPAWGFLTNHAYVLLSVARHPDVRARDVAERVGITERAAQRILGDLVAAGFLSKTKVGRRNRYTVHRQRRLHHPLLLEVEVGPLIDIFDGNVPAPTLDA
jgi:hypothetical protein